MRTTRRGLHEVLVLGAGLLSTLVLGWAAFRVVADPRVSGQAALSRLAGDVADGVVAEWNRSLREDAPPAATLGEVFTWGAAGVPPAAPAPLRDAAREPGDAAPAVSARGGDGAGTAAAAGSASTAAEAGSASAAAAADPTSRLAGTAAFDALLGEARRLDVLQQDPAQALGVVLDALERAPDAPRRGAGHLRAIQLAVRTERRDVALAHCEAARAQLDGHEVLPADAPVDIAPADTSLLLLCALAAGPALDEAGRDALCADVTALWCADALALPDPEDLLTLDATSPEAGRARVPPRREALCRRLQALSPPASERAVTLWRHDGERRRLAALARVLGSLPGTGDAADGAAPHDGAWQIDARAALPFLWRIRPDGAREGHFTTWAALSGHLQATLEKHALLPGGFLLDWGTAAHDAGDAARARLAAAPLVRERSVLCGEPFGFVLRHRDPQAVVGDESRRAAWLRGGLLVLALLTAVAAALTARTLRRERALAGLRSAFIAGVSHELRTPVSSILLMADNLQAGRVGGEAALSRYHALIRREALRLRRLVDDVLDMSRLERSERVRLAIADVALPAFVADLVAEAREVVERAGGHLSCDTGALPATATLDAEAVRRAVLNLVDNALRHSGSHDVALGARVERGDADALVLSVADGGRGIAPRDRERVFEPFERLEGGAGASGAVRTAPAAVPSSAAPGVGLGLAIVRAIARGHGGEARVAGVARVAGAPGAAGTAGAAGAAGATGPGAVFEIRLPLDAGVPAEAIRP